MHDADGTLNEASLPAPAANTARDNSTSSLKPKGACWYCNAPLDNIKRFCNKTCALDYQTEEETFR